MAEKIVKDSQGLAKDLVNDCISRQTAIDVINESNSPIAEYLIGEIMALPSAQPEQKSCKTCHLWEGGEINIACPWGSNYEHYEDDYCSLWEKQN